MFRRQKMAAYVCICLPTVLSAVNELLWQQLRRSANFACINNHFRCFQNEEIPSALENQCWKKQGEQEQISLNAGGCACEKN